MGPWSSRGDGGALGNHRPVVLGIFGTRTVREVQLFAGLKVLSRIID